MKNYKLKIINYKLDNRGMVALLTVIIVSATALLMAFSASMLGLGEMDMGYTSQKGQESLSFVNGCAEESLRQLQLNANWPGGTLNLMGGSCIISVFSNGNNRVLTVSGTIDNFTKKLQILASVNNGMVSTTSWQEQEN
ncbi:MAG TPA: hypothetical protein DEB09_04670 [Candidatus Magasanikbacteria bacterium]|nr:hypothetical protein [Candidatus Magasanikbacteria bacterium]